MPLDTLENTLAHELSDLLSAENQFSKALQQVVKSADSPEVKEMAQTHFEETQGQIVNLKEVFTLLGQKPERGLVCKGAQGIVEENTSTLKEDKPKGAIKDMLLVAGTIKAEHYEIVGYTSALSIAKALGRKDIVPLLQANLKQEQATAKKMEAVVPNFAKAAVGSTAPAAAPSKSTAPAKAAAPTNLSAKSSAKSLRQRRQLQRNVTPPNKRLELVKLKSKPH
jgi:ferritin-like metal-binding protein YciE